MDSKQSKFRNLVGGAGQVMNSYTSGDEIYDSMVSLNAANIDYNTVYDGTSIGHSGGINISDQGWSDYNGTGTHLQRGVIVNTPNVVAPTIDSGWQLSPLNAHSNPIWEEGLPNKLDKELIDSKLPYNLKKDSKGNLFYEISCAGYDSDQILIQTTKDGFKVILFPKDDSNDLVGDDYEYLCKGIKTGKIEDIIYVDSDLYNIGDYTAELDLGILTLKVPIKIDKTTKFKTVIRKDHKKVLI
jgi:HSP20 family molecular chaperone IbpA